MALKSIQQNIKRNTKDVSEWSLFMGGLDITSKNIDQFDPLRTGYARIFIVKLPRFMEVMDIDASKRFKHLLEMGFIGVDGIQNTSMDTEDITGGYAGNKFQIPSVVKDETDSVTIKVYEFSGSPIREYTDTWMTGISDPLTGISHYHGVISDTCQFKASNHTMEMIFIQTDPTGREDSIEYACMFANMMPKVVKKDHFNYEPGSHPAVQIDLEFTATRYESPQINEVAQALLAKFRILRDYLDFQSGYTTDSVNQMEGYSAEFLSNLSGAGAGA